MNRFKWIFLLMWVYSASLTAATTTAVLPVTASISNTCDTLTANTLAFGNYNPVSNTPTDATNTISVRCTQNDSYSIALDGGSTAGGSISQRLMTNGSQTLNYNLFTSSAHSTVWGNDTTGSTVSGSGTGSLQTYTVYGRIPSGQVVPAGVFSDVITVSVNY